MTNETCRCGRETPTKRSEPAAPCCCGTTCACERCACERCGCGEGCACAACSCA